MKKQIIIEYDVVEGEIKINTNEFTVFEAFGVLTAAKTMLADDWIRTTHGRNEPL